MAIGEPSFKEDYQILFENSLDIIYIVDLNGKFLDVNDIGLNLFGYKREEIPDFSIKDIADEENIKKALDLIKEILEKGKQSERVEFKVRTKNGDQLDIESYGIPLKKEGEFYAILGIAHDISKRKFAEEKLKASEERYRELFRNMSSGVAVYEAIDNGNDFIFRDFNRTAGLIDNINKWEVIDKKVTEVFPGVKEFGLFEVFQRVWKTGIPEYHPLSHYKDDRIEGWREHYVYKLSSGEIITVYEEVTEEKQMEDELRESEEKFRRITEQSLMGIVILQDDKIKYVNQAVADLTGYTIEEMMSWDPKDLYIKNIHREDLPLIIEQAKKKQLGETEGVIPHLSYRIISKSGKIKWIDQYSRTALYEDKPADFITFIDITSRKEAEQKLRDSEAQYRGAYNRAEFYKDLFAHDMNNILQGILSANQLINLMQNKPDKQQQIEELIKTISQQVDRGSKLVNNVRKLSQLEEHKLPIEKIEFLNILNESIKIRKNSYQDRTIDVRIDSSSEKIFAKANILIEDVFENILINAVKHNKSPAVEIVIKISKLNENGVNYLKMEFIDNGIGVEEHRKANIFQRVQKDTQSVSGMGLGLSIVKKIIDSYDGKIWVEDRVKGDHSKGSNFVILIPEGE